jgi:hypothetical protein
MEYIIRLEYPAMDILKLQDLLRQEDCFVALLDGDFYNIAAYLDPTDKRSFTALLDRNVYTRITSIVEGTISDTEDKSHYRWAAAVLAFCQIADITFYYDSSLDEYASKQGGSKALAEFDAFHLADNSDPKIFLDFSVGNTDSISSEIFKKVPEAKDRPEPVAFENPRSRYYLNYVAILKIAILSREEIEPVDRMLQFLDWMYSEFMFGAPAMRFANIYFSPQRHRRMIKNFQKPGIENAAWDLSLVQYWRKMAIKGAADDSPVLLITRDKAMREIAKGLVAESDEEYETSFTKPWGSRNNSGSKIFQKYCDLSQKAESDPNRTVLSEDDVKRITVTLEEELFRNT